jgi:hypothetical protein
VKQGTSSKDFDGPTIAAKSAPGFAGGSIMPTKNHNSVSVQVRPATAELRPKHIPLRRLRASQPRSTNCCARYPTICQNQSVMPICHAKI